MTLFGVHIPELQLTKDDYIASFRAAQLTEAEHYVELGSGHGIGLVLAAKEFGAIASGVEYVTDAIERAHSRAAEAGITIQVERGDILQFDPSHADVLHMHLGPAFHDVLADRLEEKLYSSTRVIAAGWRVPGWLEVSQSIYEQGYVYRPADPLFHGSWHADSDCHPTAFARETTLEWATNRMVTHRQKADAMCFTSHTKLSQIEIRAYTTKEEYMVLESNCVVTATGEDSLHRGQSMLIGLTEVPPQCSLTVYANGYDGLHRARGATLHP